MIDCPDRAKLSPVWAEIGKNFRLLAACLDLVDEWQHPGLVREKVNLVCRHDYRPDIVGQGLDKRSHIFSRYS